MFYILFNNKVNKLVMIFFEQYQTFNRIECSLFSLVPDYLFLLHPGNNAIKQ